MTLIESNWSKTAADEDRSPKEVVKTHERDYEQTG